MALEIVTEIPIESITHPHYQLRQLEWFKWRLTYEGGWVFINEYLQQHKAESDQDFKKRKQIAFCPAFSKAAIRDVINSIFQRFPEIVRTGGSNSYQTAIIGHESGVDLTGTSMNTFMGSSVLDELLIMGKVGVYIDMPVKHGVTLADTRGIRPYLYVYKAEDIRSWEYDDSPTPNIFKALLLRDTVFIRDAITKLPTGTTHQYRYYYRSEEDGRIYVQFYNENSEPIDPSGEGDLGPILLDIERIPFVTFELNNSLMSDIADYQISLLNIASSTVAFGIGSNFPFYTEQFDPRAQSPHITSGDHDHDDDDDGGVDYHRYRDNNSDEITVGPGAGRKYAKGLERPKFINPSAEPLTASLQLQESMKLDIRLLINLSITNLQLRATSAESRGFDERSLESGLCYIGLVMEDGERQIANIWQMYERSGMIPIIKYPEKYNLLNAKDTWAEIEELKKQMLGNCSVTFKRSIAKRIADLLLGHRITPEDLKKIYKEIDESPTVDILVDQLSKDVQVGILDPDTAATLRGYPEGTADKAAEHQAKRLKLIQAAQTPGQGAGAAAPGARGLPEASPAPDAEVQQEKDAAGNPVRGPGQNNKSKD